MKIFYRYVIGSYILPNNPTTFLAIDYFVVLLQEVKTALHTSVELGGANLALVLLGKFAAVQISLSTFRLLFP